MILNLNRVRFAVDPDTSSSRRGTSSHTARSLNVMIAERERGWSNRIVIMRRGTKLLSYGTKGSWKMIKELLIGFLIFYLAVTSSVGTLVFILAIIDVINGHNGR